MSLPEICIKRPVFATVLSLVVITLGIIFYTKLQIRGVPDIDFPVITIDSRYSGADALYMEKEITTRIEKAVKNVKYLDFMTSRSSTGSSSIALSFKLNADIEIALNDVRSKISEISAAFPSDMTLPSVSKMDADNFPSLWLAVNTDRYDQMELTRLVDDNIKTILEKLPTVGRADIYGGKFYTMRIEPDMVKMYQYKIAPMDIEAAILRQNQDYPAGLIKTDYRNFALRLKGTLSTPEEFGEIVLATSNQHNLKLKDLAKVYLAPAENDAILRYNGNRAIAVGIAKQSKSNLLELSKEVRAQLVNIRKNLPPGVEVSIAYDGAIPVDASVRSVFKTIAEAIILVVLVTYLFLGSLRLTIIPLVTIPVSLIATFSVMYAMGFSINTFSLLAMVLAIGLVVDDAIVMLENVFRHSEMGKSPKVAAIDGAGEISFAVVAMTITLASVFLPIGFIEGFLGKLFIEFAWTLAFCVLFSGFVALTLTPMMSSLMVGVKQEKPVLIVAKFNHYVDVVHGVYVKYLNLALDHKKYFFLVAASSVVVLVGSFIFVNKIFVPQEDDGFLQVAFMGPEGSSAAQSEKSVIEAEQVLSNHKDVFGYFSIAGWGGSGDSAFAFVPLKDWSLRSKSQEQIKNELNGKFASIPGMSIFAMNPRSLVSGNATKPVEFNLQTSLDYEQIDKISDQFVKALKNNPLFQNVERDLKSSTPTIDINVDRDKAYLYGTNLETIGMTVQYLIAGKKIGDFRMGNDIYDVVLQYSRENRNQVNDVKSVLVRTKKELLPLEVFAKLTEQITVKSYSHYNNSKSVTISSDLSPGSKVEDAIKIIDETAAKLIDTSNTKLEYLGEIKRQKESQSDILLTFLFALIFIYLVLAAQFESFFDPLIILMSVPFSITGGVVSLLIAGNSINMYSNIGLITLIGLVTKNAIMIVEFANHLRESGHSTRDAVVKASQLRLRPILMTSLATVLGAAPLIFAEGAGAASRSSIGLVVVGGMILGTIFTVFVIPVLYQSFKRDLLHQGSK